MQTDSLYFGRTNGLVNAVRGNVPEAVVESDDH
jgi:hypothetical protein